MAFETGEHHARISESSNRFAHTPSSCPDLIRASIVLRKSLVGKGFWPRGMDCRERRQVYAVCARQTTMPGNDELLARSQNFGGSICRRFRSVSCCFQG